MKWFLYKVSITELAKFALTAKTHCYGGQDALPFSKVILLSNSKPIWYYFRLKLCPNCILMKNTRVIITICFSTILEI